MGARKPRQRPKMITPPPPAARHVVVIAALRRPAELLEGNVLMAFVIREKLRHRGNA